MNEIIKIISQNKEWIFSGIGVLLISIIITIFSNKNRNRKIHQRQKIKNNSFGIQANGDVIIKNVNSIEANHDKTKSKDRG